jgi:Tfp pilus assembly protein PilE
MCVIKSSSSARTGVTAIELVVVTLVIAALATIAIPRLSAVREQAGVATARSDLRNLASLQELYFSSNITFSSDTLAIDFSASEDVSLTITEADQNSWAGTALHAAAPTITCQIAVNSAEESEFGDNQVVCAETTSSNNGNGNNGNGNGNGNNGNGNGNGNGNNGNGNGNGNNGNGNGNGG